MLRRDRSRSRSPRLHGDRLDGPSDRLAGPSSLDDVAFKFVRSLGLQAKPYMIASAAKSLEQLATLASDSKVIRVGSICSGSGAGEVGLQELCKIIKVLGPHSAQVALENVPLEPIFMCERDPQKVEWLAKNLKAPIIFENAGNMGFRENWDQIAKKMLPVPTCEILTAGFSCKDLSALNVNKSTQFSKVCHELEHWHEATEQSVADTMAEKDLSTTALTLGGILRYIARHRPSRVIIENVRDFLKIMQAVQQALASKGYVSKSVEICPSMLRLPSTRPRIYLVAAHDSRGASGDPEAPLSGPLQDFQQTFNSLLAALNDRPGVSWPIQKFLLNPDEVQAWTDRLKLKDKAQQEHHAPEASWTKKHDAIFKAAGILRPSSQELHEFICERATHSFQKVMFNSLPVREREIIFFIAKKHDKSNTPLPLAKDVSQTIDRSVESTGSISCLTSSWGHYLFTDGSKPLWRRLLGEEAMAVQGLTQHQYGALRSFSDPLLSSLAGNAFCLPCFVVVAFAMLAS